MRKGTSVSSDYERLLSPTPVERAICSIVGPHASTN